jgi:hypothetical protein
MWRLIFIPSVAFLALPSAALADKFMNTGPGTINTCDSVTQVGIGVVSTDSLPYYSKLVLGANEDWNVGGRLQINTHPGNDSGRAAFFDNVTDFSTIPRLRVLEGSNAGSVSVVAHWNLSTKEFRNIGKITSETGFWVNSTELNVPDFVFDESYRLGSLEETELFIRMNRHLPDMPSAAEVAREGLNLAEMNLKILRKVEELTLHVINQEKKIRALEEKLAKKDL